MTPSEDDNIIIVMFRTITAVFSKVVIDKLQPSSLCSFYGLGANLDGLLKHVIIFIGK